MSRIIRYNDVSLDTGNVFNPDIKSEVIEELMAANSGVETDPHQLKAFILQQASRESDALIASARAKVIQMIGEAEREAEKKAEAILENAQKEGYEKGYKEGKSQSDILVKKAEKELADAIKEREEIIKAIEPEMVHLVIDVLENILGKVRVVNEQVILNLIHQGILESTITGEVNIRVSQADFETVIHAKDKIDAMAVGAASVEIIKDLSLKESDCVIETQFGSIDCSLDQQFRGIKNSLYYILDNRENV